MAIKDYSTDPDLNVQISGINIAEGCPPSGINNAIRQLMADVKVEKDEQAAKDAEQDAKIAEALDKVGLPLGFEYVRLTGQTAPLGGVDYMGQTATRAMYADLWAWLQENKPDAIVSESEWQSLYASQNGNVAKYSTGDGSTTFRFPRVVGYFKGAGSTDELGQYIKEGLPEIAGAIGNLDVWGFGNAAVRHADGAFYLSGVQNSMGIAVATQSQSTTPDYRVASFNASRFNPIYSASDHVTPETVTVVMGVIAFGSVASIGEATEEGIVAELGELGATKADASELAKYLPLSGGTMTGGLSAPFFSGLATEQWLRIWPAGVNWDIPQRIQIASPSNVENPGEIWFVANNGDSETLLKLSAKGGLTWGGSTVLTQANGFFAPNLSAGVGIPASTTYTVPSNGFLIAHVCSSNSARMDLTINGATLGLSQDDTGHDQICIPVKKGDTVSWRIASGNMNWTKTVTFYPAR